MTSDRRRLTKSNRCQYALELDELIYFTALEVGDVDGNPFEALVRHPDATDTAKEKAGLLNNSQSQFDYHIGAFKINCAKDIDVEGGQLPSIFREVLIEAFNEVPNLLSLCMPKDFFSLGKRAREQQVKKYLLEKAHSFDPERFMEIFWQTDWCFIIPLHDNNVVVLNNKLCEENSGWKCYAVPFGSPPPDVFMIAEHAFSCIKRTIRPIHDNNALLTVPSVCINNAEVDILVPLILGTTTKVDIVQKLQQQTSVCPLSNLTNIVRCWIYDAIANYDPNNRGWLECNFCPRWTTVPRGYYLKKNDQHVANLFRCQTCRRTEKYNNLKVERDHLQSELEKKMTELEEIQKEMNRKEQRVQEKMKELEEIRTEMDGKMQQASREVDGDEREPGAAIVRTNKRLSSDESYGKGGKRRQLTVDLAQEIIDLTEGNIPGDDDNSVVVRLEKVFGERQATTKNCWFDFGSMHNENHPLSVKPFFDSLPGPSTNKESYACQLSRLREWFIGNDPESVYGKNYPILRSFLNQARCEWTTDTIKYGLAAFRPGYLLEEVLHDSLRSYFFARLTIIRDYTDNALCDEDDHGAALNAVVRSWKDRSVSEPGWLFDQSIHHYQVCMTKSVSTAMHQLCDNKNVRLVVYKDGGLLTYTEAESSCPICAKPFKRPKQGWNSYETHSFQSYGYPPDTIHPGCTLWHQKRLKIPKGKKLYTFASWLTLKFATAIQKIGKPTEDGFNNFSYKSCVIRKTKDLFKEVQEKLDVTRDQRKRDQPFILVTRKLAREVLQDHVNNNKNHKGQVDSLMKTYGDRHTKEVLSAHPDLLGEANTGRPNNCMKKKIAALHLRLLPFKYINRKMMNLVLEMQDEILQNWEKVASKYTKSSFYHHYYYCMTTLDGMWDLTGFFPVATEKLKTELELEKEIGERVSPPVLCIGRTSKQSVV